MKTALALILLSLAAVASNTPREPSMYKVTRLSPTELGIHCLNGGDPTGKKIGDTLIISCGR